MMGGTSGPASMLSGWALDIGRHPKPPSNQESVAALEAGYSELLIRIIVELANERSLF